MAGLVVSLAPYEKVLVGGIVMQNGPRKASLRVLDEEAGVLRLTDAMHPDDAKTPLGRCYYAAQLLLTKTVPSADGADALSRLLADARVAFEGFAFAADLDAAAIAAEQGAWYRVMRRLRPLLPQEAALLTDARFSLPAATPLPTPPTALLSAIEREPLT